MAAATRDRTKVGAWNGHPELVNTVVQLTNRGGCLDLGIAMRLPVSTSTYISESPTFDFKIIDPCV